MSWGRGLTLLACLVAGTSYSGAVTGFALLAYVLPSIAVVGLLAARPRPALWRDLLVVVGTSLPVAEVVNVLTGYQHGPAARSTFAATLCTGTAVALAGRGSLLLLVPVVGVVAGACSLGSATEVELPALATVVVVAGAALAVERERRRWTARPWLRDAAAVALLVPALAVGAVAFAVQDRYTDRTPYLPFPDAVNNAITPPVTLPTRSPTPSPTPPPPPSASPSPTAAATPTPSTASATPTPTPHPAEDTTGSVPGWLRWLLAVLLLPLLVGLRLLWVRLAWRRLARRLRKGPPPQQVRGAWVWASLRSRALGAHDLARRSPDVVAAGAAAEGDVDLVALAQAATRAYFAPDTGTDDGTGEQAWLSAQTVLARRSETTARWRRVRAAFRAPARPAT